MGKETAKKVRTEVLEIYADEQGREYLKCNSCGKLFESYLMTLNSKSSRGGKFPKTKCRDCSVMNDGIGEAAREIGKLLTNVIPPITINL